MEGGGVRNIEKAHTQLRRQYSSAHASPRNSYSLIANANTLRKIINMGLSRFALWTYIKREDYPVGRRGKRGARGGGEEGRENVAERIKRLGRFLSNFLSLPPSPDKNGNGGETEAGGQELAAF